MKIKVSTLAVNLTFHRDQQSIDFYTPVMMIDDLYVCLQVDVTVREEVTV